MSNRTSLRMRVLPRFPARIVGTNGLTVVQDNLDLVVKPDLGSLVQVPSVSNPTKTLFLAWDRDIDSYQSISFQDLVDNVGDIIIGENLVSLAALSTDADKVPYFIDTDGNAATYTVSSYVRGISDAADGPAFLTEIGAAAEADLGTAAAEDVGFFADAAQGAKADTALQPTTTMQVPAHLASAIEAPAIINPLGYPWPIFAFNGGAAEYAKATAIADYQPVMGTALATGEKVRFPKWEYPVRSLGLSGTINAGVNLQADTPVDVECASGAKFIAGECFVGIVSAMIRLLGNTTPTTSTASILTPFSWRGGIMSGEALTAAHGAGSGFGAGLLDVSQYFNPLIEGILFDTGVTTPALNVIGCGYIDTGLGLHGNIGSQVIGNGFRGFFDVGVYDNGIRIIVTLGTNPVSTANGSPTVTITHAAHGLVSNERIGLAGPSTPPISVGGLSLFGEYAITVVNANSYTITASANATSGATGGTGARITMPISQTDYMSIGGEQSVYHRNYFLRCGNGSIAVKRNLRHVDISHNRFRETSCAVALAPIDVATAEGHKALITHNALFRVTGHGIRVIGGGMFVTVADNHIENFGKQLYDETVYTNFSSDFPPSAIWLQSVVGANVHNNTIAQTGTYKDLTGIITGEEPCSIRLSKNANMIDGSSNCSVHDNIIIDVPRPFLDQTGNSGNRWKDNVYSGNSVPVIITPTNSIVINPDAKGTFTPVLAGSVANFTSYDLQSGSYYKHGDVCTFAVYIDLAAVTGGSGNITITGLPIAAKTSVPAAQALNLAVLASAQMTHSSASYTEFQASISAGSSVINLFEVGSNVILALTEARFGANSRIAVTGSFIVDS
jgi:hypothetical protein